MKKTLLSILTISMLASFTCNLHGRFATNSEINIMTSFSVISVITTSLGYYTFFKGITGSLSKTMSNLQQSQTIKEAVIGTSKAIHRNSKQLTYGSILAALGITIFKSKIIQPAARIGAEDPRTITRDFDDGFRKLMGYYIPLIHA